jgi:hypothetical protein
MNKRDTKTASAAPAQFPPSLASGKMIVPTGARNRARLNRRAYGGPVLVLPLARVTKKPPSIKRAA